MFSILQRSNILKELQLNHQLYFLNQFSLLGRQHSVSALECQQMYSFRGG